MSPLRAWESALPSGDIVRPPTDDRSILSLPTLPDSRSQIQLIHLRREPELRASPRPIR